MRTKLLISFLEDACCASSGFAGDVLMLMINDHDEDVDFVIGILSATIMPPRLQRHGALTGEL